MHELSIKPVADALATLQVAMSEYKETGSLVARDGCIQRFEYTFELADKTMRRYMAEKVLGEVNADLLPWPDVIREAAKHGLLNDPVEWFNFRKARNQTSHAYKGSVADDVFSKIPLFIECLDKLLPELAKRLG